MTTPTINFRPSMTMQWWAVASTIGGTVTYKAVQSATRPTSAGPAVGPFSSKKAADQWIATNGQGAQVGGGLSDLNPMNWLASIGGGIASGIESGFVNFFKDVWNVIVGPLEVLAGILIGVAVLVIYFKNDIMALASLVGMAA
jgi:hypothetical protein